MKWKTLDGNQKDFTTVDSAFLICKHLDAQKEPFKIFIFERIKAEKPEGKVTFVTWEEENSKL